MTRHTTRSAIALLLVGMLASACGDDAAVNPDGSNPMPDAPDTAKVYRQIEHLGRPAINEALLISNDFLNGYNATAPSFKGVDPATLNMVVGEAKTVLKALYLGGCLLNGTIPGITAATGVKPGAIQCHAIGPALWVGGALNGTVLTPESVTAAQAYADKVFAQFIPDVLRIDTTVAVSTYLSPCMDLNTSPLLCGGRFVNNDVVDITYNYLLAGAAIGKGAFNQFNALVTDGVNFSLNDAENVGNFVTPVPNPQQGHPSISQAFPYSAAPL